MYINFNDNRTIRVLSVTNLMSKFVIRQIKPQGVVFSKAYVKVLTNKPLKFLKR